MYTLKNKVQLIGNLGQNPEVKSLANGRKYAKFTLATNDFYKNADGEKVKETQWHNLISWGKVAEVAEKYLIKGTEVAIEGKLTSREYVDKAGVKKFFTEIQVAEVVMLGKAVAPAVA